MNPQRSKLQHQQEQELETDLQHTSKTQAAREFQSVEQMLREDASATVVPAAVEERLSRSVRQHPKSERTWWRRWRKR